MTAPYPAPGGDPMDYVDAALAWLVELAADETGPDWPLVVLAQRLASIALDRHAQVISLANRLAALERDVTEGRTAHPSGPRPALRYVTSPWIPDQDPRT